MALGSPPRCGDQSLSESVPRNLSLQIVHHYIHTGRAAQDLARNRALVHWSERVQASSTANYAKVTPGRLAATRVVRDHVARQSLMKAPKALICSGEPCSCMSSRVIPDISVMSTLSPLDNYFWQELLVMCRAPNVDRSSTSFRFSAAVGNFDKHSVQGLGVNKPVLTSKRRREHIALLGIAD